MDGNLMEVHIMKNWMTLLAAGVFALSVSFAATAEENDVELDLLDEGEIEDDMVNRLELPESASDQGRESSRHGLDTATEARERGREFGQERAAEARERGQAAQDAARDGRDAARERRGPPQGE